MRFNKSLTTYYTEIGQTNPIRFEIFYRDGETMKPQTAPFKCKDFFNDLVSKLNGGPKFQIYSFNAGEIETNEDGVYVRVKNIADPAQFMCNIEATLNAELLKMELPTVTMTKLRAKRVLLKLPLELFNSTYRISLASWIIRMCNYGVAFSSLQELCESDYCGVDNAIKHDGLSYVKKNGFKLAEKYQKYWYYSGKGYENESYTTPAGSVIHNNGVMSWVSNMEGSV